MLAKIKKSCMIASSKTAMEESNMIQAMKEQEAMRLEAVDYCGKVDCQLVNDNWGDNGSVFESQTEEIYCHPLWNCSVVLLK